MTRSTNWKFCCRCKLFSRANRQFIVHIRSVVRMDAYFNNKLKLTRKPPTKEAVLVSKEKSPAIKKWMGQ